MSSLQQYNISIFVLPLLLLYRSRAPDVPRSYVLDIISATLTVPANQIADKGRDKKAYVRSDPVDASAPSPDEKVRFTYDLYRTTKVEVRGKE